MTPIIPARRGPGRTAATTAPPAGSAAASAGTAPPLSSATRAHSARSNVCRRPGTSTWKRRSSKVFPQVGQVATCGVLTPPPDDPVLSSGFGFVEGRVGEAQQLVPRSDLRVQGDAEARRHMNRLGAGPLQLERGELGAKPLGEPLGAERVGLRQEHGELLAAEPG